MELYNYMVYVYYSSEKNKLFLSILLKNTTIALYIHHVSMGTLQAFKKRT